MRGGRRLIGTKGGVHMREGIRTCCCFPARQGTGWLLGRFLVRSSHPLRAALAPGFRVVVACVSPKPQSLARAAAARRMKPRLAHGRHPSRRGRPKTKTRTESRRPLARLHSVRYYALLGRRATRRRVVSDVSCGMQGLLGSCGVRADTQPPCQLHGRKGRNIHRSLATPWG